MKEIIAETYEIIKKLGHGGGGNVYLARHLRLEKNVVLKADKRKLSTPAQLLRREVDVLKDLKHPAIPQVYDFFVEDDTVYTAMEYVEGQSLDKVVAGGRTIPQPQVVAWALQLLDALDYLHSPIHGDPPRGFLHSDIKPANIMYRVDGSVSLIDFNIALALGEENIIGCSAGYASPEHYGLDYSEDEPTWGVACEASTSAGDGTEYASVPDVTVDAGQQAGGNSVSTASRFRTVTPDVRSDLYSLGATLYHLLTGIRAARDARQVALLTDRQCSGPLAEIINRAMQPNPNLRYQTAREMYDAVASLWYNDPRAVRLRRRHRAATILSVLLLGVGVVLAFTGLKRMQTTESWLKLAEYSVDALEQGDTAIALDYALQAFPARGGPFLPEYVVPAQRALTNAMGVYNLSDTYQPRGVVQLPSAPLGTALSPDGAVAACVISGEVVVLDTAACSVVTSLDAAPSALAEVVFLDQHRLAYAGATGLCVYDLSLDRQLWQGGKATRIAVSADGNRLAAVYRDEGEAKVYDAATGRLEQRVSFEGRSQRVAVNDIFFNPHDDLLAINDDGSIMAASFSDGSLELFRLREDSSFSLLEKGSSYRHFEGGFWGKYFAFSAVGDEDSILVVMDTETMEQTGGYRSRYPFGVQTDAQGIYVQTENILVRLDPVSGEQTPLVTTAETIRGFAKDSGSTVIATEGSFQFFDFTAALSAIYQEAGGIHFLELAGETALAASRDSPRVRLLTREDHRESQLLAYDPSYPHDEARISGDGQTVMLFSIHGFRVYGIDGRLLNETVLPRPEQIYDQQFRRTETGSWLEVCYYDGTILRYDANNGALLDHQKGLPPDRSLYEEFYTDTLRIESPLHGGATAYDRNTGRMVAQLSKDGYLTYVTQAGEWIIAQYVTTDRQIYGELLNNQCQVLADLPFLCDVVGGMLLFDYPAGCLRSAPIYTLEQLLRLARADGQPIG